MTATPTRDPRLPTRKPKISNPNSKIETVPTVVITRPLVEEGVAALREAYDVRMTEARPEAAGEDALIEQARAADALITVPGDPVTARVIEACPRLKVIAQYAVGVDNIDLEAARRSGVVVTHTPDVVTGATADFAMALLLAVARPIPAADAFVRDGRFVGWETRALLGMDLRGKRMGIVGMGRIGAAVARRAIGFGMEVLYHNRHRANPTVARELSARYVAMDELLRTCDILSLHCPLTDATRHLIDAEALRAMKPTALLINTARGPVVDEAALAEALAAGEIAGAGLDVFEEEPHVHPGLLEQERVVLAPHVGSATTETRTQMGRMCSESVRAALEGAEKIPHRIA